MILKVNSNSIIRYNVVYDLNCTSAGSSTLDDCLIDYESMSVFSDFLEDISMNIEHCGFVEDDQTEATTIRCHLKSDPSVSLEIYVRLSDNVLQKIQRPENQEYFRKFEADDDYFGDDSIGHWGPTIYVNGVETVFNDLYDAETYLFKKLHEISNYPVGWEKFFSKS